jgi:hypothetical protein
MTLAHPILTKPVKCQNCGNLTWNPYQDMGISLCNDCYRDLGKEPEASVHMWIVFGEDD